MRHKSNRLIAILGSRRFFIAILAFFIFEAVWIALSATYPMAFDEDFHFGLIRIYSHHWLPFLSSQPPGANVYGAITRDPSYLYHYLMSFPYRLIATVIHGQTGQVIALRLLNVALFASGIGLFRKVLLKARLSAALTNVCLLIFALIPIAPQLAAHINYDNLIFPLVALTCLLTFKATDQIRRHQPSLRTLLTLFSVGFLASQVKYAFVPIFAGAVLFLILVIYRHFKGHIGQLGLALRNSWRPEPRYIKILLLSLIVIALGLFAQRDGVNLVKYHSLVPNCSSVLSVKSCQTYGPWAYSYAQHQTLLKSPHKVTYLNPVFYVGAWAYWMWYRLFFAVSGPANSFTNYPPLPIISATAIVIGLAGVATVIMWRRRILHNNPYFSFFIIVIVLYVIALWIDGYGQYRFTDTFLTMNGRYLLPIMLLVAAFFGRAISLALSHQPSRKAIMAVIVVLLFLQGGGFLTFITRSDSSWDWPNSTVVKINNAARKITKPFIIKGSKYYSTKVWFFN